MTSTSSSSSSSAPLQAPSPPSHDDPTSGPGASLQGVSAHGLVSLERAEHILQRVIDTVNDQGLQISSLYLLLQTLVGTETNPLPRSLLNVEGNFSRLNQRLEHVEKAIHVPGVAPGVSIGEVVSTNGVELNHALDALHKKANQADVEARQHKLEEEVAEVYAWAGARELVERLEESNRATRTQVHAMEAALGCKVDKAEMAGMEATLNRLKVFNSRMEGLEQRQAQDMAGVRAEVQLLQERRLAAEQQLEVTRKALGALEEKHGAWKRETLELLKEVDGELAQTASLAQLEGKLDARVWEREWRLACERLDSKVDLPEMAAMAGRVEGVEEDVVRLGRESDQYSRFVAWFYSRGEAYEHNLKTLDRTIGRLAKESLEKYVGGRGGREGGRGRGREGRREPEVDEEEGEEGSDLVFSSSSSERSSSSPGFGRRRRGQEEEEEGEEIQTLSPVALEEKEEQQQQE